MTTKETILHTSYRRMYRQAYRWQTLTKLFWQVIVHGEAEYKLKYK